MVIYNDNQSALHTTHAKPGDLHARSQHYAMKLEYLHDLIDHKAIELHHMPSTCRPADQAAAIMRAKCRLQYIIDNLARRSSH
jgi:hypothetical protein